MLVYFGIVYNGRYERRVIDIDFRVLGVFVGKFLNLYYYFFVEVIFLLIV